MELELIFGSGAKTYDVTIKVSASYKIKVKANSLEDVIGTVEKLCKDGTLNEEARKQLKPDDFWKDEFRVTDSETGENICW